MAALLAASLLPIGSAEAQERQCSPEDVSVGLRLSQNSYNQDERVRMRLVAENTSSSACEMQFPSGRGGTIRVFQDGDLVWEHGYCRVYTQHIELETWEPGHRESWGFRWKQHFNDRDKKGRLRCDGERPVAPPGRYEARGIFFGTEPDAKTDHVAFRITG